ncbi:MAG TPA: pyridoxamine 5'-phosphate oxidase family protein [Gemmatimonadaceae bacterium]|jgi:general stress protein 26|nr:pyridoxamine 5'-phosphate oxidase family protein [Gemmatimonadaceae bacterium]
MDATDRNRDEEVPLEKKLDDLYELIDGIETAMFTTRRPDGSLVSRAMQTQRRTMGTDLWFMTNIESDKFEELALDPHVNVAYFRDRTREWVSVSGHAILSRDRDLIDSLYKPDWKAWLGDQGDGVRDGGAHDPRIVLVLVEADSVVYSKNDRPLPLALFQVVKGMITGQPPKVADLREIDADELRRDPGAPRG